MNSEIRRSIAFHNLVSRISDNVGVDALRNYGYSDRKADRRIDNMMKVNNRRLKNESQSKRPNNG